MPLPDRKPKFSLSDHAGIKGATINPKSDLSNRVPSIWDQQTIGSCSAHASLRGFCAALAAQGLTFFMPSRLAQYYFTRLFEGTEDQDSGCSIADAISTLKRCGVAKEADWAYDVDKFTIAPPQNVVDEALRDVSAEDYSVDNTDPDQVRAALSAGWPVVFGCSVYPEIESLNAANPILPMPRKGFLGLFGEKSIGGHALTLTGHDDERKLYQVDNSWGLQWGLNGRFYMPYEYIHSSSLTSDAHVVDAVKITV